MTAGHDLRRTDEPLPDLDAYLRVVACAAALVRTAERDRPVRQVEGIRGVDRALFVRLAAALEAAGVDTDQPPEPVTS